MDNLWNYISRRVKLTCADGETYIGDVLDVAAAEDIDDNEDSLSLELKDGKILGVFASEIAGIEILHT